MLEVCCVRGRGDAREGSCAGTVRPEHLSVIWGGVRGKNHCCVLVRPESCKWFLMKNYVLMLCAGAVRPKIHRRGTAQER